MPEPVPIKHVAPRRVSLDFWDRAWARFSASKASRLSGFCLAALLSLVLIAPFFLGGKDLELTQRPLEPPSSVHWFGTDLHGRDLCSRVLSGARISLMAGGVGAMVSLVLGVSVGAVAGYLGGRWDGVLMRLVDMLYSTPSVLLVIVLITVIEDSAKSALGPAFAGPAGTWIRMALLFGGLGAVSWLTMARVVRGQVISLKVRPFVEASRALGAGHVHILLRHVLPNIWGVVIAYMMLTVPGVILYESFLSYLGLGIQPPHASLGTLIAEGAGQLNPIRVAWWLLAFPGGFLALTLALLTLFGDGLRDALDPEESRGGSAGQ